MSERPGRRLPPIRQTEVDSPAQPQKRPITAKQLRGKPVGAVIAASKIIAALHESPRPLNASEVARLTALYRGTAHNILRTLQSEGLIAYNEETRTYSLSLRIVEMAHGVLRKSGLMNLARPLMHSLADAHDVTVYLAKVREDYSMILLDWVGAAFRIDDYVAAGRHYSFLSGATGVVLAAFTAMASSEVEIRMENSDWYDKPSLKEFRARMRKARAAGIAVDRGNRFRDLTQVSTPILSASSQLVFIMTAVGYTHQLNWDQIGSLSRDILSTASRVSDGLEVLRLA